MSKNDDQISQGQELIAQAQAVLARQQGQG